MNRNQKIALGCGGAGCLGLIVVAIAGGLIWYLSSSSSTNRNRNYNFNVNTNSNTNRSSDSDTNSSSDSSATSSSSMSDDDKHKLFQAAGMTKDNELIRRVLIKIGFMNESGATTPDYEQFVKDHFTWALKNTQFVMSVNDEAKAREYVDEHLD